jgi:hypothetical protein
VRPVGLLLLLAVVTGCTPKAALIPPKASTELNCPADQLQIVEKDSAGDTGPHYAMGCGKRAVYEMNPFGEWVITGAVQSDPKYVKLPPAEGK